MTRFKVGDTVQLRDGSGFAALLAEAAERAGYVGDAGADERGERLHLCYEAMRLHVPGLPAERSVLVPPPGEAP